MLIKVANLKNFSVAFVDSLGAKVTNVTYQYSNQPISILPLSRASYETGTSVSFSWIVDSSKIHREVAIFFSAKAKGIYFVSVKYGSKFSIRRITVY